MGNITIERARPDDREAMAAVLAHRNMLTTFERVAAREGVENYFVAKINGEVIGTAGFEVLSEGEGMTRSLAVLPEFEGTGVGKALQDARLEAMHALGVKTVTTYADRPGTIVWYKKHYGCVETGKMKKPYEQGLKDEAFITVLSMDVRAYMASKEERDRRVEHYMRNNEPFPLTPYAPLMINVALTGVVPTKRATALVPTAPEEIIADAERVYDAGARIVHLHARDRDGLPSSDARYFERIITGIRRERPGLICCATTSGRHGQSFEERAEVLELEGPARPDMASLTLGSLNFLSGPSVNTLETVQRLAIRMREKGIRPEMEVFDSGMVNAAKYLERHGIIEGKKYFNILLGNLNTAAADIGALGHITSLLPENSVWAAAGLGGFQLPVNMMAVAAGGHVRVGIEDSIYYDIARSTLASNEALVKRMVRLADELQRPIATPEQARKMSGLSS